MYFVLSRERDKEKNSESPWGIEISRSDALPLSHRDSMVSEAITKFIYDTCLMGTQNFFLLKISLTIFLILLTFLIFSNQLCYQVQQLMQTVEHLEGTMTDTEAGHSSEVIFLYASREPGVGPFREVEPDTGFPIYAFFSHFRFWMASGCKSDWSIHYIWLQIKRLNAEIETLGANLTEVMQKENDTANQVSLYDNQTTSTRKILMIGLARDLNVGDRLIASDHGLTSYELALFLRCRIFQKVHQECPLKWRSANYPWS